MKSKYIKSYSQINESVRIPKVKMKGIYYHGSVVEKGEFFDSLNTGRSDWDAIWFSDDENVSNEFSDNWYNEDDVDKYKVIFRCNINIDKVAYIDYDRFKKVLDKYELTDLREFISILKENGYNGWKTIGSIGSLTYDDYAVFDEDDVNIQDCKLYNNGDWTDYISLDEARKIVDVE